MDFAGIIIHLMSPHVLLSFCPKIESLALSEMVMGMGVGWLWRAPWAADFARIWISAAKPAGSCQARDKRITVGERRADGAWGCRSMLNELLTDGLGLSSCVVAGAEDEVLQSILQGIVCAQHRVSESVISVYLGFGAHARRGACRQRTYVGAARDSTTPR
ncbi:hypothetical protein AB1N83_014168 [Pleurotus pulmonarius]